MDTDQNTATPLASTATEAPEVRGAGGKLRKPPPRKPPATPYARPPETARRPWLSKLVDPAFRLIAGGATRILPSFFSSSSSSVTPTPTPTEDQGNKWQAAEQGYGDDSQGQPDGCKSDLNLCEFKSSEMTDIGDTSGGLKRNADVVLNKPHESGEQAEENRLCDIERLVKGNKLSRDEFNRLVELLNSRAVDLPKAELGKENTNLTSRKDDEGLAIAHGLPKFSIERRHEESKGAIWGSSTPLRLSNVQDQIDASPIEIARAYMDSRATEASPSCKSMIRDVEGRVLHGVEAAVQPYDPSPYVKTSTCWPGVVVQDAYITPQGQRSRHRLHNFPRTPYSRTLLSKSKSRLTHIEGDSSISSTPPSQSQKVYLQDNSKVDASETGYGSFGPIRRINRKVGSQSSSRGPAFSSLNGPSKGESSVINKGFTPTVTKSLDPDGTSTHKHMGFETGVPAVHMHTSLMAKKILEHIDRSVPTPKEKSAELNLASKWKSPESSVNLSTSLSNENYGLQKLKGISHYKYDGLEVKKSTPSNEGQGNCHVDIFPRDGTDKSIGIREGGTLGSDVNVCSSIPALGNEATSMQSYGHSQISLVKSTREDALKPLPGGSEVNREKKLLTNSLASKPVLAPISIIKRPDSRWTSASDNGSGFTFPVATSSCSSVFSEPPTPSITPLFSSGVQNQSRERPAELSYSFGLKRSNPALVFSFPSTSNSAVHSDSGVIKFNFGSNDKARLSFSIGKNAVCC